MHFNGMLRNRNVVAWFLLISTLALHVIDESITGFLPFYNQMVESLRKQTSFFPAPTFSFELWLGGLITGVSLCFGLTVFVAGGGKLIRWIATVVGVLMLLNALGHLSGSAYFDRILPGTWSSPLLLVSAVFMILRGVRGDWHRRQEST